MKKIAYAAFASTAALALSACGTSEDASTDAEVENVEINADEAVGDVTEEPVEDAAATGEGAGEDDGAAPADTTAAVAAEADSAGAAADAAAADVANIQAEAEAAANRQASNVIDRAEEVVEEAVTE